MSSRPSGSLEPEVERVADRRRAAERHLVRAVRARRAVRHADVLDLAGALDDVGRRADRGMTKSSSTWKTIDSSLGVRGVATSVSPPGISTDSSAAPASRKRTAVRAALGPSRRIPSSSSSATCSLSGTRLSR